MKNRPLPYLLSSLFLNLTLLLSSLSAQEKARVTDHGIAAGKPEAILPGNAIIHAKIQNIQSILENVEALALNTIPEKALPPAIRPLFHADRPLLTLLGMPLVQAPLTSEALAQRIGIDSEAEITLTLYPGDPTRFFIASIGIADSNALTETLSMVFGPNQVEETSIGGRKMLRIQSKQIPIGSLFISCSKDRAYITGEPSLLIHLHEPGTVPSLVNDVHMGEVLQLVKKKDIAISINPGLIKPFTAQIPFFKYVPLTFLSQARTEILKGIPERQRKEIEQQIQQQTGINSIEEILDYAECFIAATYEHVFDTIYENIDGLNGATFAIQIHNAFPELSFYLHHDRIQVASDTAPIPLAATKEALAKIARTTNHLNVSGKQLTKKASPWVSEWITSTRQLMVKKGLNTKVIDTIQSLHETTQRPSPIEANVPWTIQMAANVNPSSPLSTFDSIEGFIADRQSNAFIKQSRPVTVVPQQHTRFLKQHFQSQITARQSNRDLTENVFAKTKAPKWILTEQRLEEESLSNNVVQFTLENAYISQTGLFGYNQHEFINRKIYLAKNVEDYLVYHQASEDATWLNSLDTRNYDSGDFALKHLVERLPSDVNVFRAHRGLDHLIDFVNWIEDAEALIHRDIHSYLEEVQEIAKDATERTDLIDRVQALSYSPIVASINQDESGKFYCLLPGNLTFPRAKIAPVLGKLIEPFEKQSTKKGGMIAYTRTLDGTKEWSVIWNTEGVSTLIQSVGNAVVENYLENPEGIQEVMNLVFSERDRDSRRMDEVLAKNPTWRFLDQIQIPGQKRSPVERPLAAPQKALRSRDENATAQQIDLGPYFNASLDETWHQGGIDNNDLSQLPHGFSTIGGVDYDLRGIIQLTGHGAEGALSVKFPAASPGIKINQQAERLHFLHACGWKDAEGTRIATYVVHYKDGETIEIPVEYGIHVRDWWAPTTQAEVPSGDIAWIGSNGASSAQDQAIQLYHLSWKNPRPEASILSIDFESEIAEAAPFLMAITVAAN
jgi:hypothetical protein